MSGLKHPDKEKNKDKEVKLQTVGACCLSYFTLYRLTMDSFAYRCCLIYNGYFAIQIPTTLRLLNRKCWQGKLRDSWVFFRTFLFHKPGTILQHTSPSHPLRPDLASLNVTL